MAKVAVMCWQEIPSAVEVKDGEGTQKVQLSNRFLELIDMIAMRRKLAGYRRLSHAVAQGETGRPGR